VRKATLVGTVEAVCGSRVTVHRGRLDWITRKGLFLVAGDDVVLAVIDSQGRRPCRVALRPAQAARLASMLLAPADEPTFTAAPGGIEEE
jgi:hypothetical protein